MHDDDGREVVMFGMMPWDGMVARKESGTIGNASSHHDNSACKCGVIYRRRSTALIRRGPQNISVIQGQNCRHYASKPVTGCGPSINFWSVV